jgi:ATP-binding cassette subfamily A (ABC1) protein 3
VLFELLTAQEHLDIFYDFKGADPAKKTEEITKLISDVGLEDKKHTFASKLSGGSKRKLSSAMALCGGSKLIIMDEPTSSLDLSARRKIWNMLKEYKKDRIILLTTHYMDEADILGDRIGIIAKGKISCLGSSLFLKRKFGVGYNLSMIKSTPEPNAAILSYCAQHLGNDVQILSEIKSELTLQIPNCYVDKFNLFFSNLDRDMEELKISTYGISLTTLEDVFLKVGHL